MDKTEAIARAQEYLKSIKKIISYESAYLFGSYTKGDHREDSDIDIGIIVKHLDADYLTVMKSLYKLRRDIDVRIEPHLFVMDKDILGFSKEIEKKGLRLAP
jgi:uncharacterized protein